VRKRRGGITDFRDDLLRGIDTEPRHFGQTLHGVVVMTEERRHLLIELAEVILDQSQFLQRQLYQSPIHGMEIHARTEGIA
jgi:hypothetical protein